MRLRSRGISGVMAALFSLAYLSLLLPLFASSALADDVLPGLDLFETDPGTTWQDFNLIPIPADFFGPGSDPFEGTIQFGGNPGGSTLCPNDDLSRVDTIVERLETALVPNVGDADVIDIEIVSLSLRSVAPITVTSNGGQDPQLWDVDVELSTAVPQEQGSMTIRHLDPRGGTFDSVLPVIPRITFTRDLDVRVLDFGLEGIPGLPFEAHGVPWTHSTPPGGSCTSNFCVNPGDLTQEQALLAQHGVLSICPSPAGGNHFTCYKVKDLKEPKFQATTVRLKDQFMDPAQDVEVKKPFLLCNPTDKNGEGINDPDGHLCCYKVKGPKFDPKKEVEITDQFGTLKLGKIKKPRLLCQPCSKTEL